MTLTVKEFVYLTDDEKNNEYKNLLDKYNRLLVMAEEYKRLCESNSQIAFQYKELYEKAIKLADTNISWGIDAFGFGGINSKIEPELFAGLTATKYFNLKFLYIGLGGGGYVNLYRQEGQIINFDGGGAILQIKLLFKKRG
jgi:hypothetical protein